jgi:hypothetical protein
MNKSKVKNNTKSTPSIENMTCKSKTKENINFGISPIWVDVMRIGLPIDESAQHDAEWWIEHQSEVNFAFKVLGGLGLAECAVFSDDKKVKAEAEKELDEAKSEGDEGLIWNVRPTDALMRLYREAEPRYRREREALLKCSFIRCFTADWGPR